MIEIKNVSLERGNKKILDSVSLVALDNEITVLLGENGSGKTSLFMGLLDIKRKDYQGDFLIDNQNSRDLSSKELAKLITFNFQIKGKSHSFVYEMLELARTPYKGFSFKITEEEQDRIDYAVKLTGIEDLLFQSMDTLSGGERQMVYLAMSIIQNTKYIIFDEPETYLDMVNKKRLYEILDILKEEGHSIILSLHSLESAFSIADRIYVMHNGTICGCIPKEDFDKETIVEDIFKVQKNKVSISDKNVYIFR